MCGIAGIIDLTGSGGRCRPARCARWPTPSSTAARTRTATSSSPACGFANRRLSIVGLADGRQPISNEDRTVAVVFNGELFDYPEVSAPSSKAAAIASAPTATPSSFRTCGKTTARRCSSSCAASSPSPCGTNAAQR